MKRLLSIAGVVCLMYTSLSAQTPWRMQPTTIQTRWAKSVNPKNVLPEYPRPQLVRGNWTNLNGLWEYAITSDGAQMPGKFDGNILVPYPIESALSGVKKTLDAPAAYNPLPASRQTLWYKRKFTAPALKTGERLILNFGAVSWDATVFLNTKEAGNHKGSYTAFSFDVTDMIKPGENEISLKVTNPLGRRTWPSWKTN